MGKSKMDNLIKESLEEEVAHIKMSFELKEKIRKNTIYKEEYFWNRLKTVLDRPVKLSICNIVEVCLLVLMFIPFSITVTEGMKRNDAILGYTNLKVVNVAGTDILMDNGETLEIARGEVQ